MTRSTDRTSATSPRAVSDAGDVDPAVVAWVVQSCDRQGVPVKVTDAAVVARVAALLGSDPASASHPHPTSAVGPRGERDERELRAS